MTTLRTPHRSPAHRDASGGRDFFEPAPSVARLPEIPTDAFAEALRTVPQFSWLYVTPQGEASMQPPCGQLPAFSILWDGRPGYRICKGFPASRNHTYINGGQVFAGDSGIISDGDDRIRLGSEDAEFSASQLFGARFSVPPESASRGGFILGYTLIGTSQDCHFIVPPSSARGVSRIHCVLARLREPGGQILWRVFDGGNTSCNVLIAPEFGAAAILRDHTQAHVSWFEKIVLPNDKKLSLPLRFRCGEFECFMPELPHQMAQHVISSAPPEHRPNSFARTRSGPVVIQNYANVPPHHIEQLRQVLTAGRKYGTPLSVLICKIPGSVTRRSGAVHSAEILAVQYPQGHFFELLLSPTAFEKPFLRRIFRAIAKQRSVLEDVRRISKSAESLDTAEHSTAARTLALSFPELYFSPDPFSPSPGTYQNGAVLCRASKGTLYELTIAKKPELTRLYDELRQRHDFGTDSLTVKLAALNEFVLSKIRFRKSYDCGFLSTPRSARSKIPSVPVESFLASGTGPHEAVTLLFGYLATSLALDRLLEPGLIFQYCCPQRRRKSDDSWCRIQTLQGETILVVPAQGKMGRPYEPAMRAFACLDDLHALASMPITEHTLPLFEYKESVGQRLRRVREWALQLRATRG